MFLGTHYLINIDFGTAFRSLTVRAESFRVLVHGAACTSGLKGCERKTGEVKVIMSTNMRPLALDESSTFTTIN